MYININIQDGNPKYEKNNTVKLKLYPHKIHKNLWHVIQQIYFVFHNIRQALTIHI